MTASHLTYMVPGQSHNSTKGLDKLLCSVRTLTSHEHDTPRNLVKPSPSTPTLIVRSPFRVKHHVVVQYMAG